MTLPPPPRTWREGRELNGDIRRGQTWVKRDCPTFAFTVMKKQEGDSWRCAFSRAGRNSSHKLRDRDIWKYYDKLS
jgi:hypothetical protein